MSPMQRQTSFLKINKQHFFFLLALFIAVCPAYCTTYYVDPNGSDSNPGTTIGSPFATIPTAVSAASAGDTIYLRGCTHTYSTTISISKSGTSSANYYLLAYPNDSGRPVLNFSSMVEDSGNRGIKLTGNYWYIKGIDIYCAGDNGIWIGGSYNTIEFCRFYENKDSGLQISGGGAYNEIINCDSYYNADSDQGDADGFAIKMDVGTGNYLYGCRSWNNSDDAYDGYLRGADDVTTTYENCWAIKAGYLKSGSTGSGNGNGFKMGGSDDKDLKHNVILKNCLAFHNWKKGFDQNSDMGDMTLYNCTGFDNGTYNYSITTTLSGNTATLTNCTYYTGSNNLGSFVVQTTNDWTTSSSDFVSVDPSAAYGDRQADGSLPEITFMHLATGSSLIDAGTDVGEPYNGSAPDIGCFESGGSSLPGAASSPTPSTGATNVSLTQDLSWTAGSGATSHNVYFGTTTSPSLVSSGQTGTTYDTGTMTANTTYYWRIDENNTYGTTTGTVWSFTTLPAAPGAATNPTPANGATSVSITTDISWTAGSGATTHDIYFGTTTSPSLVVIGQSGTTYDTGTMAYSTTYYWRIDENNAGGTTTGTLWSFTTAAAPLPGAATNPSPADSATSISVTTDLSWTAGSDATSHNVYFGTASSPSLVSSSQTGTTYDTGTMNYSTTYYWRIDENNASGTTTGTVWSFTTTAPAAPDAASNPTPSSGATDVSLTQDLSWTAGSGATSHDVYFGTTTSPSLVSSSQTGTTYDTGTMDYNTTYYWRIDEKNIGGTTTGTIWSFTTLADTTAPAAPTGLEAIADDSIVMLDWNNNSESDLAGYNIYRSTTSGSGYVKLNSSLLSTPDYNDTNVTNATTYYYVVTAVDIYLNESAYSSEISAIPAIYGDFIINGNVDMEDLAYMCNIWLVNDCNATAEADLDSDCMVSFYEFSAFAENWQILPPDITAPAAPTGLQTTPGDETVSLDWDDNTEEDLAGYNVYRSTTSGSGYSKLNGSPLTSSNYTDSGVSNDVTFYYVVTAVDASSNESGSSSEVSATPADATAPAAPTGLSADAGDSAVSLDWSDSSESDLAGYNIYRSTTSGSGYVQLNSSLLTSSDYTDSSVTNGTTYYYIVTAVDTSANESEYSSEVSATPTAPITSLTIQEDTDGFCFDTSEGSVDNNNDGYTGTGFVNTTNGVGYGIDWSVEILTAGTYTFTWRYSCTSSRPANLLVNGSTVLSSISFPTTSSFTTWTTVTTSGVTLTTGVKTIRLEATGSGGLVNIDYIQIDGPNLTTADCQ